MGCELMCVSAWLLGPIGVRRTTCQVGVGGWGARDVGVYRTPGRVLGHQGEVAHVLQGGGVRSCRGR